LRSGSATATIERWPRQAAADVLEYLNGIGRMLQEIDTKLEEIRDALLEDGDDGEAESS
jgi:hypothetical protein